MDTPIHVNIPDGTDLNNGLPPEPPTSSLPDLPPFPEDIFECLPPLLRCACDKLEKQTDKEVFLIGALGVLSGMMPNVQGMYFGRQVHPNLYCFVVGSYGTGKGALLWAKDLGEATENHRQALAKQSLKDHHDAQLKYLKQQKLYDKGKAQNPPEAPPLPRHLKLFLPANSTKTAVMQLLMENEGRGIVFETEGDTLADMLRQDYGNFSDVLRKAFHHEPISYYRRANNEDVKINRPALSVVLSGTEDQLRRLIPSIDNGLFSRFCFYFLQSDAPFLNPFDAKTSELSWYFNSLSDRYMQLYKRLEARTEPVQFVLQPHQQALFVSLFDKCKTELRHVGTDLDGTANRLGLICYRIAMILTIVRFADNKDADSFSCTDIDFNNASLIAEHLLHYSLHVYELLNAPKPLVFTNAEKTEKIAECCRNYGLGVSLRKISIHLFGSDKNSSTILKWVNKYCKNMRA